MQTKSHIRSSAYEMSEREIAGEKEREREIVKAKKKKIVHVVGRSLKRLTLKALYGVHYVCSDAYHVIKLGK